MGFLHVRPLMQNSDLNARNHSPHHNAVCLYTVLGERGSNTSNDWHLNSQKEAVVQLSRATNQLLQVMRMSGDL